MKIYKAPALFYSTLTLILNIGARMSTHLQYTCKEEIDVLDSRLHKWKVTITDRQGQSDQMWQFLANFWLFLGSNGDFLLAILTYFGSFFTFTKIYFWLFLAIFETVHLVTLTSEHSGEGFECPLQLHCLIRIQLKSFLINNLLSEVHHVILALLASHATYISVMVITHDA